MEHSLNDNAWNRIRTVTSYGESKVQRSYSFVEMNPARGQNLYRLKIVDKDETLAYSSLRNITFEAGAKITTCSNPVTDRLLISNYYKVKDVSMNDVMETKTLQKGKDFSERIDISITKPEAYTLAPTLFAGAISTHEVAVTK